MRKLTTEEKAQAKAMNLTQKAFVEMIDGLIEDAEQMAQEGAKHCSNATGKSAVKGNAKVAETAAALEELQAYEAKYLPEIAAQCAAALGMADGYEAPDAAGDAVPYESIIKRAYGIVRTKKAQSLAESLYGELSETRQDGRKDNAPYAELAKQAQDGILAYKEAVAKAQGKTTVQTVERTDSNARRLAALERQREQAKHREEAKAKREAEKAAIKAMKARMKKDDASIADWNDAQELRVDRAGAEQRLDAGAFVAVVIEESKEYFILTDISRNTVYVLKGTDAAGRIQDFALPYITDTDGNMAIVNEQTGKTFPFYMAYQDDSKQAANE